MKASRTAFCRYPLKMTGAYKSSPKQSKKPETMDINQAVEALQEKEKTSLVCSTQERVESFKKEGEWFVIVSSKYEDGETDRMELKMSRFAGLYASQKFSKDKTVENNTAN